MVKAKTKKMMTNQKKNCSLMSSSMMMKRKKITKVTQNIIEMLTLKKVLEKIPTQNDWEIPMNYPHQRRWMSRRDKQR